MTEGGGLVGCVLAAWRGVGAGSLPPTPHLTSPLVGGRDELGRGREREMCEADGFLPAQE